MLLTLEEAASRSSDEVGGKALGLAKMALCGLPVPDALVLPAAVHEQWLGGSAFSYHDAGELWKSASTLGKPLAVRSSATDEDVSGRSAAGQYESVMDVRDAAALAGAITRCYMAGQGERAVAYRRRAESSRLALVLQREIASDRAGVAFSADPMSGSAGRVLIEAAFGHGEGIVSGELAPDRYAVDRASGRVRARVANKPVMADGRGRLVALPLERSLSRTLRDDEARRLAKLVVRAEQLFEVPVDVEFCFSGNELWLLQCRPITTLNGVG